MFSKIKWDKTITLYGRKEVGYRHKEQVWAGENNMTYPYMMDLGNPLTELYPEEYKPVFERAININQVEQWLEKKFHYLPNGIYYLNTRCLTEYPKLPKKKISKLFRQKKKGRPLYSYNRTSKHRVRGKPYKRRKGSWNTIAKFQKIGDAVILEKNRKLRKHPPRNKPPFPLIKLIKQNKKILGNEYLST